MNNFIISIPESGRIDTENFKRLLKNTPQNRRILFGRRHLNSESFFETFWNTQLDEQSSDEERTDDEIDNDNQFLECAYHIWNEFRLWEMPEILTTVG